MFGYLVNGVAGFALILMGCPILGMCAMLGGLVWIMGPDGDDDDE